MKIKIAILESDKRYLDRVTAAFTSRFSEKLELYSFSDPASALEMVREARIDVLLAGDDVDIDPDDLPDRCGFAYLTDSIEAATYNGRRAICKFQKADAIYKEILSLYSEVAPHTFGARVSTGAGAKVLTFLSAAGGAGSSTLAAACAMALARRGHPVLYLNLEQFGDVSLYFGGQGQFDFGDVIYAVKSRRSNLALKLESLVKRDDTGVHFYGGCKTPLDITEMRRDDLARLLEGLSANGYSHIVVDADFSLHPFSLALLEMSDSLVFVSDGSEAANAKFARAHRALQALEQQSDRALCSRIALMYNKFDSQTGRRVEDERLPVLGGLARMERTTNTQLLEQLREMPLFDKLI
ncbi:MAG: chromosome partitioning protein ParA [Oscillospiraceae bacterium]|jgi:Flp pilus assembly CpaE family ATPase|nr:chromosome partitioning protein ParA [Oscillospiraceae bacterium]